MKKITEVNLKAAKVMMAAGAHKIDNGIHRGLVNIIKINTHKQSPKRTNKSPNYRNSSSIIIIEKSKHLRTNLAAFLALKIKLCLQ
jgi:hypothetical protein